MSTNPIPTIPDDQIKDFIDGTLRKDTPEEYVRQNIERRLVIELDYPPERIAVEFPIKIGSSTRRVDLAVFPEGAEPVQDNIELIVECKRDSVEPSARKDGVGQLKAIDFASLSPSNAGGRVCRGRLALSARSKPSSTNALRTRSTVGLLTRTAAATSVSEAPRHSSLSSQARTMRA